MKMTTTMTNDLGLGFSEEEIQRMLENIDSFTAEEVLEIDKLVDELNSRKNKKSAYDDLIAFCIHIDSTYRVGAAPQNLGRYVDGY
jgi:Ca2+-binding EF-hand superfamily protein